ncbi:MAG: hypothetical protein AAF957_10700 [Planctomycetota bacterium]
MPAHFDGAAIGDPFVVTVEVLLPGSTTPGEIDTEYEVLEASSDVRIGAAVDTSVADQHFFVPSDPNVGGATAALELTTGVTLNVLLFDTPPLTTFLTGDLEQLAGTYLASDFDLTFLDLIVGTTGSDQIRGRLDTVVIGPGASGIGEPDRGLHRDPRVQRGQPVPERRDRALRRPGSDPELGRRRQGRARAGRSGHPDAAGPDVPRPRPDLALPVLVPRPGRRGGRIQLQRRAARALPLSTAQRLTAARSTPRP